MSYSPDEVSAAVSLGLQRLGGIDKFVKPGQKVLIKPNLLNSFPAEKGVVTHPEVVRALIRLVKSAGAMPLVGDSPGFESVQKAAEGCGLAKILREENVPLIDFNAPENFREFNFSASRVLKHSHFAKNIFEVDVVINVAKLKTHGYTGLTAAVKNLFGVIPGLHKSQLHVQFARKADFEMMLLDILQLVKPVLNLVDAVVAMEGEGGPITGTLRPINLIIAGEDAVAVDSVCAAITGARPQDFGFLKIAAEHEIGETKLENINIIGEPLAENIHPDFRHVRSLHGAMLPAGVPAFIRNFLQKNFIDRPRLIKNKCKKCGACKKVCAAGAITLVQGRPRFDYAKCISCFCCQEMCKYSALKIRRSSLARCIFKVGDWFSRVRSFGFFLLVVLFASALLGCGNLNGGTGNTGSGGSGGTGAYYTGIYPSIASVEGANYTQSQAESKYEALWERFKLLISNGAVVRPQDDLVVSEGQGYALMLAIMFDEQSVFNLVWQWTYVNMQSADYPNLFAWRCDETGGGVSRDETPAPDADIFIATALFFAQEKWGDGVATFEYSTRAEEICRSIISYEVTSDNYLQFSPENLDRFNLSYMLPPFFKLLANYTGESRWSELSDNTYVLLNRTLTSANGNTANGLVPDVCAQDGSAVSGHTDDYVFSYDAMRFPFNIALDAVWFGEDSAPNQYLDKVIGNFFGSMVDTFGDGYDLDGTENSSSHSPSWVGALLGGAAGVTSESVQADFFNHWYETSVPDDQWRYYSLSWMIFGGLLATGNFRIP